EYRDNGNDPRDGDGRPRRHIASDSNEHGYGPSGQFRRLRGQAVVAAVSPADLDRYVSSFDGALLFEASAKSVYQMGALTAGARAEESDHRHRLLCTCRMRPRSRAREECYELAPPHDHLACCPGRQDSKGWSTEHQV